MPHAACKGQNQGCSPSCSTLSPEPRTFPQMAWAAGTGADEVDMKELGIESLNSFPKTLIKIDGLLKSFKPRDLASWIALARFGVASSELMGIMGPSISSGGSSMAYKLSVPGYV